MKRITMLALFPECPVPAATQRATATGHTFAVAVGRALKEILLRPGVTRRRITEFKLSVVALPDAKHHPLVPSSFEEGNRGAAATGGAESVEGCGGNNASIGK